MTSRSGGRISRYSPCVQCSTPPSNAMHIRHLPPTRKSISLWVNREPRGPHQRAACCGSVHQPVNELARRIEDALELQDALFVGRKRIAGSRPAVGQFSVE